MQSHVDCNYAKTRIEYGRDLVTNIGRYTQVGGNNILGFFSC
jgi:hypothetical protein